MQQEQQLTVPGRYDSIEQVCQFVVRTARAAGLQDRAVFHVELAVDEACTNIVEHAYGGGDKGDIVITCGVTGSFFVVHLQDEGQPFDPKTVGEPNLTYDPDDLKVGGLGMHFMRQVMDQVKYRFGPGRNELTMYKRLKEEPA